MRALALVLIGTIASTAAFACNTVADKVCRLGNPAEYTPYPPSDSPQGASYVRPQCVQPTAASDADFANKRDMIQNAFDHAGTVSKLQNDLCSLTYIFIDVPQGHSWGKWEDPSNISNSACVQGCSHIGIISSDFSTSAADIEQRHYNGLFHTTNASHEVRHTHTAATGGTASETMGLISILAHEMAHIKFRRDGGRYSTCFVQKFLNASWDTSNLGNTLTRRFRAFDEPVSVPVNVTRATSATDYDGVYDIYNNGFGTLFASWSPEEDYVEAYKVNALTYAHGPGKLNIRIPSTTGGGVRVVQVNQARGVDNVLADKMACP